MDGATPLPGLAAVVPAPPLDPGQKGQMCCNCNEAITMAINEGVKLQVLFLFLILLPLHPKIFHQTHLFYNLF